MARKGSQQKTGLDQETKATDPGTSPLTTKDEGTVNVEGVGLGEELPIGTNSVSTKSSNDIDHVQEGKNSKKKSRKSQRKEKKSVDDTVTGPSVPSNVSIEVDKSGASTDEASNTRDEGLENGDSINSFDNSMHKEDEESENVEFPETPAFKFIRTVALSVARSSANWVERHKPTFATLKSDILKARDQARMKFQLAKPIVFRWIVQIVNILLLLFMVWLDCTIRGIDSFLRMGTTSSFSILWCSFLSLTAMVGIWKVLLTLVCRFHHVVLCSLCVPLF